ncbi:MAG: NfeD family protein [Pirellulaceae bacterium]|nr:NfeD family protein [Pirellulaceae bacterium]
MAIYYSIGLLLLFLVFLVAEFFVPSAGLIGGAAFVCAVAAIACGFAHSPTLGFVMTASVSLSTPAVLYFMIRLWPHTPIGRRILNRRPGDVHRHKERTTRDGKALSELVGSVGVAKTDLLPSGLVLVNGQKLDAVSSGMAIDKGTEVVVIRTIANKIQVRPVGQGDGTTDGTTGGADSESAESEETMKSFDLDLLD